MLKIINSKKLNNKNNLLIKSGFSIGEAVLSVFILGVTMLSILTLYSRGLQDFQDERDSVIAALLAQEGVELARNIRDNNWARRSGVTSTTPSTFALFDISAGSVESDCRVSYGSYVINGSDEIEYSNPAISCSGASYVLNVDANGFYTHSSGTATKFKRKLTLDYSGDGKKMIVTAFVFWGVDTTPNTIAQCTVKDKCVFSQATLTGWGTGT